MGLVALPIPSSLFLASAGRGFAFAKPVGLLLGGYLFWLASVHLLPNRPGSIVWAFLPLLIADSSFCLILGGVSRRAEGTLGLHRRC